MNVSSRGIRDEGDKQQETPSMLQIGESDLFYLEQFKALRAKLEKRIEDGKLKTIAVTSSIAGEGKTVSSVKLALNLASSRKKKVLLIDLDLRKSGIARGLDIQQRPGLTDFLQGTANLKDIVRSTHVPGLFVIPGGNVLRDPSPLLSSVKIRKFFGAIREEFEVILIDTPPILPVADTLSVKDQVDGFIFLFRVGVTPHTMLRQALEELGEANILGVVLNGVEPKSFRYYSRYYGKYYSSVHNT